MPHAPQDPRFVWSVMCVILANTAVLAAVWYPMPPTWMAWQNGLNYGFTVFFALELCIKLLGLGLRCVAGGATGVREGVGAESGGATSWHMKAGQLCCRRAVRTGRRHAPGWRHLAMVGTSQECHVAALHCRDLCEDGMNLFDGFMVVTSLVDMCLELTPGAANGELSHATASHQCWGRTGSPGLHVRLCNACGPTLLAAAMGMGQVLHRCTGELRKFNHCLS